LGASDYTVVAARAAVSPLPRQPLSGAPVPAAAASGAEQPQVTLLGGFGLRVGGEMVPLAPGPQRLVAVLALHEPTLHRGYIAGLLWGDSTEAHAHGSLRSALWKLQMARPGVVTTQGDALALSTQVDVDIRHAVSLARALVTGRFAEDAIALLEPRFCCELLPGWYDEWVLIERERYRQLSIHALESLCEHLTASRRYGAAVLAGLAAVDKEPLRESAHRALIKVYIAEGNASEAIRRYREFERIAVYNLGVGPSAMMRSLLSQIAIT
jgi:DNA-binding SARP family transcriptional activator